MSPFRFPFILVLFLLAACRKEEVRHVEYEVSCGACDVTYENKENDRKGSHVTGGFHHEFMSAPKDKVYLKAVKTDIGGIATVTIRVDGEVLGSDVTTAWMGVAETEGELE